MKRRFGCVQPSRAPILVLAVIARMLTAAPSAAATTCTDICPGTGPCTIGSTILVDPGSIVDCTGRDLTIGNQGVLKVIGGDFVLRTDDLTVNGPSGLIQAVEGSGAAEEDDHGIILEIAGDLSCAGKIRANGDHGGGRIEIVASGDVLIPESGTDGIEADGTANSATGGDIQIEAGGAVLIQDPIHAEGSGAGENGGGAIEIHAEGDLTTSDHGHISALGTTLGGGNVRLVAGGDILLDEHIDVSGQGNASDGGEIDLEAGGAVAVQLPQTARGGVGAGGGVSRGGTMSITAGCGGVSLTAGVDLRSGEVGGGGGRGGAFRIDSKGPVSVGAGVVIDAHSMSGGGPGGAIRLWSSATVSLAAGSKLDSRGDASIATGLGADITLDGCRVDIAASAVLDASGSRGGDITLAGQGLAPMTGPQPVTVHSAASLVAAGSTAEDDGLIRLHAFSDHPGECSNSSTLACWLDTDCTVGCETGTCSLANPDTAGKATQFGVAFTRSHINGTGADCTAVCQ